MAAPDAILFGRLVAERGLASPADVEAGLGGIGIEGDAQALCERLGVAADAQTRPKLEALVAAAGDAAARNLIGDLRRFGAIAVAEGLCSDRALEEALASQASLRERGIGKRVGTLLVARGDMPPGAVRQVLTAQGQTILGCDQCGARFNVLGAKGARPDCPMCHASLTGTQPGDSVEVEGTLVAAPAAPRMETPSPARTRSRLLRAKVESQRRIGEYLIDVEIARGGMGIVYKAHQPNLDRPVALKVLLAGEGATEEMVARLYAEAEAAAKLRHPNIVAVHDVGRFEHSHYICMDFIDGEPLDRLLDRQGHLSPKRATQIGHALAEALAYAHAQGIVHRDLKPANVLLQADGEPVLTDFGLAKDLVVDKGLTTASTVLGTPDYMSPEQARGHSRKIDGRSDVFGLGALLYHMLAGQPPFAAKTPMKTMHNVVALDPPPPSQHNPVVPRELDAVCRKALEKHPADRYADAEALADDLGRWLAGEPVRAEPPNAWRNALRRLRRDRRLQQTLIIAALAMVMGSIATAFLMGGNGRSDPARSTDPTPGPGPTLDADPRTEALREVIGTTLEAAGAAEDAARAAAPDDHPTRLAGLMDAYQAWHKLEGLLAEDSLARQVAARSTTLGAAREAGDQKRRLRRLLSDVWLAQARDRGAEATWSTTAWLQAQRDIGKAIEYDDTNPRAFGLRAWLRALRTPHEQPGASPIPPADVANVRFDVDKALAADPANADALAARALLLTNRNDHRGAIALCDDAAHLVPDHAALAYVLGLACFRATASAGAAKPALLVRAIEALERAQRRSTATGDAVGAGRASVELAKALDQAGRPEDALSILDRYLHGSAAEATHPLALDARFIRGWLHRQASRLDLARTDWQYVVRVDPGHPAGQHLAALPK